MKKIALCLVVLLVFVTFSFSEVTDYVPSDSVFVFTSVNNTENYSKLKEETIFGFLLRDMGIEGMLAQQVESMKYADPEFKPENLWAILKGDMAMFVKGEIDYDALAQMDSQMSDPEMLMMNPMMAMDPMMKAIEDLSFAFIMKPAASPDEVLKAINKLLQMELQFGANGPVFLAKDNGHIIVSLDEKSMNVAMKAKSNNIRKNNVFANLYKEDNWMLFYMGNMDSKKMMESMRKASGMDMSYDILDKVEMEYSWTKGYVNNGLVLESFNQYNYKDAQLKKTVIEAGNTQQALIRQMKMPGFVKGVMALKNMQSLWDIITPMIMDVMDEAADLVGEEIPAEDLEMVMQLLESWDGSIRFSVDMAMDESGEMMIDLYSDLGTTQAEMFEELLMLFGEEVMDYNGMKYMTLSEDMGEAYEYYDEDYDEDDYYDEDYDDDDYYYEDEFGSDIGFEPYLIMDNNKMILTTIHPEYLKTTLNQVPSMENNQMFSSMSSQFKTVDHYYGILFIDIGDLLTKLLGMGMPSAVYSEVGLNNEGDSQSIFVIK